MSSNLLREILRAGFIGKVIRIDDPDNPRIWQTYEDVDCGEAGARRQVLVTLQPEHSAAVACGDDLGGLFTLSHQRAAVDLRKMVLRHGYVIASVKRN